MEIVITHLTRMAKGFCCAAGIELATGNSVRILQRPYAGTDSRLSTSYLWLTGGPFKVGNVVELGKTIPCPNPPETEDHWFNPANARLVSVNTPIQFWALLISKSKSSLTEIFGISPTRRRVSLYISAGHGTTSLGFYPLRSSGKLTVTAGLDEHKIRLQCFIEKEWTNLSVTDIRLYNDDCITPNEEKVKFVAERLAKEAKMGRVILGLGLTRPFAEHEGGEAVHWVQVNGIHIR
jgi:hypothetical protein